MNLKRNLAAGDEHVVGSAAYRPTTISADAFERSNYSSTDVLGHDSDNNSNSYCLSWRLPPKLPLN